MQRSSEETTSIEFSVDVETRDRDSGECVAKTYTFDYTSEWDKWVFVEYHERRSQPAESGWDTSRHIMWYETNERPDVDVPQAVTNKLSELTDADEIVIQSP